MSQEDPSSDKEAVFATLWEFARHTFLITAAFLIVFSFALGLHCLGDWLIMDLHWFDKDTFLDYVLKGAEYSILGADFILILALILIRGYRTLRKF